MNIPNQLTVLRIILSIVFVILLSLNTPNAYTWSLLVFLIASFTDFLDGHLARKHNLVTDFGKLMDPLADKILVAAALVLLVEDDLLPAWFVIVILFREFLVTGVRMLALQSQSVIAADKWGKLKTIFQIILIAFVMTIHAARVNFSIDLENFNGVLNIVQQALIWIVLALTIYSGVGYSKGFLLNANYK